MILEIIATLVGVTAGVGGKFVYDKQSATKSKHNSEKIIARAETKASEIILKAKDDALRLEQERRREIQKVENRMADRENSLDRKLDELDKRTEKMRKAEDEVDTLKGEVREIRTKQQDKLEKIAGLKKKDAADKLLQISVIGVPREGKDLYVRVFAPEAFSGPQPVQRGHRDVHHDQVRR